jgi:hypothetical protein
MLKRTLVASIVLLGFAGAAAAQENATLVLRSGDRISGQLVDMGGSGFTINVNGQERQIATGDVAVIDFVGGGQGLPDTEISKVQAAAGGHVVFLRSGENFTGTLYDIAGTRPLRITINTANGPRDVNSGDIGRIYLAAPGGAVATSGSTSTTAVQAPAPTVPGAIMMSAKQAWTSSGLTVRRGDLVTFQSSGDIQLSTDANDTAGPAGAKSQRTAARSPIPSAFAGALIGRVGNSAPFAIGDQAGPIEMPAAGQLMLGINDDHLEDNSGWFQVVVTRTGRRR